MKLRTKNELINYVNYGNKVSYIFFWGHKKVNSNISKSCFSQWYEIEFKKDKHRFISAEHYMMYEKANLFGDKLSCEKILNANNPGEAKDLGRKVIGFNEEVWLKHRFDIVVKVNLAKFSQHPELKEYLLSTEDSVLVEASPVDKLWGIGLSEDNPNKENPNLWKGLNLLGFALMEVREQLKVKIS